MAKRVIVLLGALMILLVVFSNLFILAAGYSDSSAKDFKSNSISLSSVRVLDTDDNGDAFDEQDEALSEEQLRGIGGLITQSKAEEIAVDRVGGRVVGFESEKENGRIIYGVDIVVSGEDVEVEVDARTGEVLEVEYGDDD